MRCRLTGAVVPTCVCPADAGASAPAAATLADPGCCERQSIESIAVGCERSPDGAATLPRPVATAAAPHLVPPALVPSAATWRSAARRPPGLRGGVSLVLLKRSLLI
jgi:hypothetical protein